MRKNDMIRTKALADYLGKKPGALEHAGTPINQVLHAPTSAFTDLGAFLRGSLALQASHPICIKNSQVKTGKKIEDLDLLRADGKVDFRALQTQLLNDYP